MEELNHQIHLITEINNKLKRLEQENEKIKKQYNCYACGNCKGTEDYINLEKHHKGLRKQFDKYHKALEEIREIVSGNYETLDPQAKQEIQNIITEAIGE